MQEDASIKSSCYGSSSRSSDPVSRVLPRRDHGLRKPLVPTSSQRPCSRPPPQSSTRGVLELGSFRRTHESLGAGDERSERRAGMRARARHEGPMKTRRSGVMPRRARHRQPTCYCGAAGVAHWLLWSAVSANFCAALVRVTLSLAP